MKFHRFAFMTKPNKEAELRPHELRDADAFALLVPALIGLGYQAGELLINHPVTSKASDTSLANMGRLTPDDLLVVTSRPPLNEKRKTGEIRVVKVTDPSENEFEQEVLFPALKKYLDFCSRNQIVLSLSQSACLEPGYRNREALEFYLKASEKVKRHEASYAMVGESGRFEPYKRDRTTAAYLIHTPPLQMPDGRKGPRVLAAFGLSGTMGLVFAHQLCEQKLPPFEGLLEDVLQGPAFAMVEIAVTQDVPDFYTDLVFSDEWEYKLITKRPVARLMPYTEVSRKVSARPKRGHES